MDVSEMTIEAFSRYIVVSQVMSLSICMASQFSKCSLENYGKTFNTGIELNTTLYRITEIRG